MISYSEREVFTPEAVRIWKLATRMVESVLNHVDAEGRELRCHELARALGQLLKLQVVDGQSVGVDHSWLMIDRHTLLDPYAPARMPMVQLVDVGLPTLARFYYLHDGNFFDRRDDIREDVVKWLADLQNRAGK